MKWWPLKSNSLELARTATQQMVDSINCGLKSPSLSTLSIKIDFQDPCTQIKTLDITILNRVEWVVLFSFYFFY